MTALAPTDTLDITPLIKAKFDLKGLKKWPSREGGGYSFSLTHLGNVVAEVTNEGRGGEIDIRWANLRIDGSFYIPSDATPAAQKKAAIAATNAFNARTVLEQIVRTTPPVKTAYDEPGDTGLPVDGGWLMEELVNFADLRKVCAKKTAFRRPQDGAGSYMVLNAPYDAKVRAYIVKKYPRAEILNEVVAAMTA